MTAALREVAVTGTLTIAGALILGRIRLPLWASVWLSVPIGFALYVASALATVALGGRLEPVTAIVVATGVGLVGLLAGRHDLRGPVAIVGRALGVMVAVSVPVMSLHPTRLTPDSLRYLVNAAGYLGTEGIDHIIGADLVKRQFGLPAIHALGDLTGLGYVVTAGPLFGVFGLGFFCWFVNARSTIMTRRARWGAGTILVVFALSSNRLLYDWFYINTHIQVAVYLLIGVAGAWMATVQPDWRWAVPAGVCLSMTVLYRPEAPLIVGAVLVAAASAVMSRQVAVILSLPSVLVVAVWYGLLLRNRIPGGIQPDPTSPLWSAILAVIGSTALILLAARAPASSRLRRLDTWFLVAGLTSLMFLIGGDPAVFVESVVATTRNVFYDGLWLLAWPALAGLTAVALALRSGGLENRRQFTTPILGYALLFWALPYFRGSPWRVGTGDSGNRILAHVFLVTLAYCALTWAALSTSQTTSAENAFDHPDQGVRP